MEALPSREIQATSASAAAVALIRHLAISLLELLDNQEHTRVIGLVVPAV